MTAPSRAMVECRVIGADKLPADSGGADAFCAAVQRAAATRAPGHRFQVEARVSGASMMTATLTIADGKRLPEQEFGISDRGFSKASLERFASNLVEMVVRAASAPANGS